MGNVVAGIGVVLLLILALAVIPFLAVVVSWNVTDIVSNGANFWNVFWLALVTLLSFGIPSAARSNK